MPKEIVSDKYISIVDGRSSSNIKYWIYDSIYKYLWYYRDQIYKNEFGYLLKQFENKDVFIINARGNGFCFYNCLYIYLCIIDHKNKEDYKHPQIVLEKYCNLYLNDPVKKNLNKKIKNSELIQMRSDKLPSIEYIVTKCPSELNIKLRIIDFPQIKSLDPHVFDILHNDENGKYNNCLTLIQNLGHFVIVLPYSKTAENMCSITEKVHYEFEKPNFLEFHKKYMREQEKKNVALDYVIKQVNLSNNNRIKLAQALENRKFNFNKSELAKINEFTKSSSSSKASGNKRLQSINVSTAKIMLKNIINPQEKIKAIKKLDTTEEIKNELLWELAKYLNVTNARTLLNSLENKNLKPFFKNQFSEEVKRKL